MWPLVEQLAAAREFGVGTPFAIVAHTPAVTVKPANEHQLAKRSRIHDLARLAQRAVVAVIEPDADQYARACGSRDHRLELRRPPPGRLLHQGVAAEFHRSLGDCSE